MSLRRYRIFDAGYQGRRIKAIVAAGMPVVIPNRFLNLPAGCGAVHADENDTVDPVAFGPRCLRSRASCLRLFLEWQRLKGGPGRDGVAQSPRCAHRRLLPPKGWPCGDPKNSWDNQ